MKGIITALIFLTIFSYVTGQKQRLNLANSYYEIESYYNAAETYEDVLERGIDSTEVAQKVAHSYFAIRNLDKAYIWHSFMHESNLLDSVSFARLINLSMSDQSLESIKQLTSEAVSKYPKNDYFLYLNHNLDSLNTNMLGDDFFELKYLKNVNTKGSDFGVSYYKDDKVLVTSSNRLKKSINRTDARTGGYFFNLYKTDLNGGELGKLSYEKSKLKSKYHDGPACYDSINNYVYFTRSNIEGNKAVDEFKKVTHLKILRGKLVNGELVNLESLPFNSDLYSTMHPSISEDGRFLFFSSNMPGGIGGFDIYKVEINEQGMFSSPKNLGKTVNTPLDESFPFIQSNGNVLFFSSYGHYGIGGLDIFYAELSENYDPLLIFNCGKSINTADDEFSFVNNANQKAGFIASNRKGEELKDEIYSFKQKKPLNTITYRLLGEVRDKDTDEILSDVSVEIKDNSGKTIFTGKTTDKGLYNSETLEGIRKGDSLNYTIKLAKEEYITQKFQFNYETADDKEIFVNNVIKTGIKKIELGETDLGDVANINPIYFDFDKSKIRPDAAKELNKIVDILNDNPGMIIELGSHTDLRGDANYNIQLSNKRAQSSVEYIVSKGVERYRIFGTGYGELIPRISNKKIMETESEDGKERLHQLNRRTEFIIMEMGEKKYVSSNDPPKYTDPSRLKNAKELASQKAKSKMQFEDESGNKVSGKDFNKENIENGFYIVLPHETLYRIYENTGVKVEDLKRINNLKDNRIEPGQKILLE